MYFRVECYIIMSQKWHYFPIIVLTEYCRNVDCWSGMKASVIWEVMDGDYGKTLLYLEFCPVFSIKLKRPKLLSLIWTVPLQGQRLQPYPALTLFSVVTSCRPCLGKIHFDVLPSVFGSWDGEVSIVARLWTRWCRFWYPAGYRISPSPSMPKPATGPTHPPAQWIEQVFSLGIKRPGHKAEWWPASIAEADGKHRCTSATPLFTSWTGLLSPISAWVPPLFSNQHLHNDKNYNS